MPKERNLFGMLDEISAGQAEILGEITGVKTHVSDTDSRIAEIEKELQALKAKPVAQNTQVRTAPKMSDKEILQTFLKQAKKSLMWFGNNADFMRWKTLAIVSSLLLLVIGLITTIVSSVCVRIYSPFTFFENVWMVFGIIYLVYATKSQKIYEVNALAANSFLSNEKDNAGMIFFNKEKAIFRVFRWLAIISVIGNIIAIWAGMGKSNQALATIMEVLFLGAIIFAFFMNLNLFAQYSIIYVEGHNLTTKERVVLVLSPGAKGLMPLEEFKQKMPYFFE